MAPASRSALGRAVVSVFPRGTRGPSGLVELNLRTGTVVSTCEFDSDVYLTNPHTGAPPAVRQARGLAIDGRYAFVAMFNSVVQFELRRDGTSLVAVPAFRYEHPSACDLHGVTVDARHVAAASTGTDAVLVWERGSRFPDTVVALGARSAIQQELNFPENRRGFRPDRSWRETVENTLHLNDVGFYADGGLIVSSLTTVFRVTPAKKVHVLVHDSGANFHDCHVARGRVFLTDGARGDLVELHVPSAKVAARVPLVDPEQWFLRGIVRAGHRFVLGASERVSNIQLQLAIGLDSASTRHAAGELALVSWDRTSRAATPPQQVRIDPFGPGSVAYALARLSPGTLGDVGSSDVVTAERVAS